MRRAVLSLGLFLFVFSGCVTITRVDYASAEQDKEAKKYSVEANKANLYIARKSEMTGGAILFKIKIDGTDYGALSQETYQLITVAPGKHKIELAANIRTGSLTIDTEGGKNYFYSTGAKSGEAILVPDISLVLIDAMGKLMISQAKRAAVTW